jgi:ribosomal protein S18 acetylase RimI-like enzyme
VIVRPAVPDDFPSILGLWARARSGHAETPDTTEALERLLATDRGALLVAEGPGIIGVVIAAFDGWRGNLYRLAVEPGRRREGIALALVRAGEQRLGLLGAPKLTALVGRGDAQAEGLWAAAGYRDDIDVGRWVRSLP